MLSALLLATSEFLTGGRPAAVDSVAMDVVFTATGGTVTPGGLYTAGSSGGTFRVIATSGGLADTSTVTVTRSSSGAPVTGIPFGPYGAWNEARLKANTEVFTATMGSTSQRNILSQIEVARSRRMKLILTMTGGAHENYLTNGVFDLAKWQARMDMYGTPDIKEAVATAVADGTVIGNSVMDEPHVSGQGDGNTWGPRGTMTKALVDQLCAYVRNIFPTLPVGVAHPHRAFEPANSYTVCDFIVDQYSSRQGDINQFRDDALAMGRRDGIAIVFSMNIINGGIQARRDGLWNCPLATTGGRGTHQPNCRMTAEQVRDWGRILGSAGCAMIMWRYDETFMSKPENQQAFKDVTDHLATLPGKPCRRL